MKRTLCLLLTGLVLGCATTDKAVFRETANQNVLDLGSSRIYIDKRFVLVGDLKGEWHGDNIDDRQGSDYRVARYLLVDASEGKDRIRRGVVIKDTGLVKSTHTFLHESNFDGYKSNFLDKGITERIGARCAYLVHRIDSVPKDILQLGASNGFFIDKEQKSAVEVWFTKNTGSSRNVQIMYVEAVDASQSKAVFENAVHFIRFEM